MKKILAIVILSAVAVPAMAQHHGHHGGHHRGGGSNNWIAPVLIGGVIGYGLTRQYYEPSVVVQQQPVYVQQPVYIQQSNCTVWTETQHPNGTITRTRTCTQ